MGVKNSHSIVSALLICSMIILLSFSGCSGAGDRVEMVKAVDFGFSGEYYRYSPFVRSFDNPAKYTRDAGRIYFIGKDGLYSGNERTGRYKKIPVPEYDKICLYADNGILYCLAFYAQSGDDGKYILYRRNKGSDYDVIWTSDSFDRTLLDNDRPSFISGFAVCGDVLMIENVEQLFIISLQDMSLKELPKGVCDFCIHDGKLIIGDSGKFFSLYSYDLTTLDEELLRGSGVVHSYFDDIEDYGLSCEHPFEYDGQLYYTTREPFGVGRYSEDGDDKMIIEFPPQYDIALFRGAESLYIAAREPDFSAVDEKRSNANPVQIYKYDPAAGTVSECIYSADVNCSEFCILADVLVYHDGEQMNYVDLSIF